MEMRGIPDFQSMVRTTFSSAIRCFMKQLPTSSSGASYYFIGKFLILIQQCCHTTSLATHMLRWVTQLRWSWSCIIWKLLYGSVVFKLSWWMTIYDINLETIAILFSEYFRYWCMVCNFSRNNFLDTLWLHHHRIQSLLLLWVSGSQIYMVSFGLEYIADIISDICTWFDLSKDILC